MGFNVDESTVEFFIKPEYLCCVPVEYNWNANGHSGILSHVDHPSFAALRERLGYSKKIEIQRGWHNGDRVTKQFRLNGVLFKVGDKFCSAGAMKYDLRNGEYVST